MNLILLHIDMLPYTPIWPLACSVCVKVPVHGWMRGYHSWGLCKSGSFSRTIRLWWCTFMLMLLPLFLFVCSLFRPAIAALCWIVSNLFYLFCWLLLWAAVPFCASGDWHWTCRADVGPTLSGITPRSVQLNPAPRARWDIWLGKIQEWCLA